jgi:hypothetical protein
MTGIRLVLPVAGAVFKLANDTWLDPPLFKPVINPGARHSVGCMKQHGYSGNSVRRATPHYRGRPHWMAVQLEMGITWRRPEAP